MQTTQPPAHGAWPTVDQASNCVPGSGLDNAHRQLRCNLDTARAAGLGCTVIWVEELRADDAKSPIGTALVRRWIRGSDPMAVIDARQFVCMTGDAPLRQTLWRLESIYDEYARLHPLVTPKLGWAELEPDDDAPRLMARAHATALSAAIGSSGPASTMPGR